MAKNDDKAIKCYYCGELITRSNDLVIKKVPMATKAGIRNYSRKLHLDCVRKYNEGLEDTELKSEENSEWDKVYQYFKNSILGMEGQKIDDKQSHLAKRLLGLRLGSYYPNAQNTRILPRGYDFKTILVTLKVVNPRVQVYLKTANFANFKHKIDGIMKFVVSEIPDVAKRIEDQKKANSALDNRKEEPSFDYKEAYRKRKEQEEKKRQERQTTGQKSDLSSAIEALLGGSL